MYYDDYYDASVLCSMIMMECVCSMMTIMM